MVVLVQPLTRTVNEKAEGLDRSAHIKNAEVHRLLGYLSRPVGFLWHHWHKVGEAGAKCRAGSVKLSLS
jgi:hypothetical protein